MNTQILISLRLYQTHSQSKVFFHIAVLWMCQSEML